MDNQILTPDEFTRLLRAFNGLVGDMPPIDKVKEPLAKIRESAMNSHALTPNQRDAITARCDNYMKGQYGNTKKGVTFSLPPEKANGQQSGKK